MVVGFSHPNPGHTEFLSAFHPSAGEQGLGSQAGTVQCRSVSEVTHHLPLQPPSPASLALLSPNTVPTAQTASPSFLGYKRAHQNLQEETFSQVATEEFLRNTQVNVPPVISSALCRYFTFCRPAVPVHSLMWLLSHPQSEVTYSTLVFQQGRTPRPV